MLIFDRQKSLFSFNPQVTQKQFQEAYASFPRCYPIVVRFMAHYGSGLQTTREETVELRNNLFTLLSRLGHSRDDGVGRTRSIPAIYRTLRFSDGDGALSIEKARLVLYSHEMFGTKP